VFTEIANSCEIVSKNFSNASNSLARIIDQSSDQKNGSFLLADSKLEVAYSIRIRVEWSEHDPTLYHCLNVRVKKKNHLEMIGFYDVKGLRIRGHKLASFVG